MVLFPKTAHLKWVLYGGFSPWVQFILITKTRGGSMTKHPPNLIKGLVSSEQGKHRDSLTVLDERAVQIHQLQSQEFPAEVDQPEQPSARTTLFIMDLNNSGLE